MQINLASLGFGRYIERESWRRGALRYGVVFYAFTLVTLVFVDAFLPVAVLRGLPYVSTESLSGVVVLALAALAVVGRCEERPKHVACATLAALVALSSAAFVVVSAQASSFGAAHGHSIQMSASNGIPLMFLGVLLLLRQRPRSAWIEGVFNATALACIASVLGALLAPHGGATGWLGATDHAPAAVYSSIGTLMVGLLAWWQWYFPSVPTERPGDEHRIVVVAAAVLVLTSLFTGFTVMSVFARYIEAELQNQLTRTFNDREEAIRRDLAQAQESVQVIVHNRPHLRRLLAKAYNVGLTESERAEADEILNNIARGKGVLAFEIKDPRGAIFGRRGAFTSGPALTLDLRGENPTVLLWNNRFTLRTQVPMAIPHSSSAALRMEIQFDRSSALSVTRAGLGSRGDFSICGSERPFKCYSGRTGKPETLARPAVSGTGGPAQRFPEPGNALSVAGPIGGSGLTLILKVDRSQLLEPLRMPMMVAITIGVVLILLGLALMRWQVFPLVIEVVNARRRVHAVIEHSGEGIMTFNDAGLIQTCNVAALSMFGYSSEEMLGRFIKGLLPDVTFFAQQDLSVLPRDPAEAAPAGAVALTAVRKNGDTFPAEVTVSEIPIDGQRHHVAMVRDNTERERVQQQLRERHDALEALNRQLREAQNQLLQSEKMASIGQLAAGVAHEINNPIGYVFSNLGTLEKYLADLSEVIAVYEAADSLMVNSPEGEAIAAVKEKVDLPFLREDIGALMSESKEGITRVKKIVHDLKDFSHVHDSDEWQAADLHQCLDSTLNIVRNELKYKAEIVKHYGQLPAVECLPSQINQVFMNLLVNAGQAIETRGTITLTTGTAGDAVWIEIADTGKGIAEEHLTRIFDPFFTTKPVGSGTGLGLSLSYGIVQKHHGTIQVTSTLGKGTSFTVWLPMKRASTDAAETAGPAMAEIA